MNEFNNDDVVAIDFASQFLFGKPYVELLNFLNYMGKLLINVFDLRVENEAKEVAGERQEAAAVPAQIGFQIA